MVEPTLYGHSEVRLNINTKKKNITMLMGEKYCWFLETIVSRKTGATQLTCILPFLDCTTLLQKHYTKKALAFAHVIMMAVRTGLKQNYTQNEAGNTWG